MEDKKFACNGKEKKLGIKNKLEKEGKTKNF
jgi:hypothetical protein